jgi:hypothetical protein
MGSSFSADLRNGLMSEQESMLREAMALIDSVASGVSECIGANDQFDDAAEDGALRESLWRAMDILREAIPLTEQERAEKIASLERQLARLKKA